MFGAFFNPPEFAAGFSVCDDGVHRESSFRLSAVRMLIVASIASAADIGHMAGLTMVVVAATTRPASGPMMRRFMV